MTLKCNLVEFRALVWLRFRLFFIFALAFSTAGKAQVTPLDHGLIQQLENIEYIIVDDSDIELEKILLLPAEQWQTWQGDSLNLGFKAKSAWIRFLFQNISELEEWVLSLRYTLLDELEIYILDENRNRVEVYLGGDMLPFYERVVHHHHFVFPFQIATGKTYGVYLKVKSERSLQVPIFLSEKNEFYAYSQKENLFIGFLVGLPLIMMMHNIFVFFRVRDRSQIDYMFYVAAFTLLTLALNGLGYQYLWPYSPSFQKLAVPIASSLVILAAISFFIDFLQVKVFIPQAYRLLVVCMGLMVMSLAIGIVFSQNIFVDLSLTIGGFGIILLLYYLIQLVKRKAASSLIFTISIIPALLGVSLIILNKLGFIGLSFWTENGAQLGVSLQICILYFALTDRYRDEKKLSHLMEKNLAERSKEESEARLVTESLTSLPHHIPFGEYLLWKNCDKNFNHVWQGIFPDKKNKRLFVFVGQVWAEDNDISATLFLGLVVGAFQMLSKDIEFDSELGLQEIISIIDQQVIGVNPLLQKEMSFIFADIDFREKQIKYINAGHCPVLLLGEDLIIRDSQQPVWKQSAKIQVESLAFKQGDELLLVSGKKRADIDQFFIERKVLLEINQRKSDAFQVSLYEKLFPSSDRCELQMLAVRLESENYL
ncbi:MAG: 7TM diverse intracellular signaling domain-containing protein [Oligoflexus sp.]